MKRTLSGLALAGITGAGLMAIPANALAAPTLSAPLAKCYSAMPPKGVSSIPVSMTGGTAGDGWVLSITDPGHGLGSLGSTNGNFDASGNATTALTDIYPPDGESINPSPGKPATLSVEDFNAAGDVTSQLGSVLITNRALDLGAAFVDGSKARTVSVSGTQFANKKLYGFVVHKGKVIRRFAFGKGNVCGYTKTKLVLIPKSSATGNYVFYVNAGTKLNKKAAISKAYTVERF